MTKRQSHSTTGDYPRSFVAADAVFDTWQTAEPYYRDLAERTVDTPEQFERFLRDFSEVDAVFNEECTRRRIETTQQTDDPQRQQRFADFMQNVYPHREPWHDRLRRKIVDCAARLSLPARRYEVMLRSMRNAIALYRDENVPLEVEDAQLKQRYQEIVGTMSVTYQGRELTLEQLARFQEEPDRRLREETHLLGAECFASQRQQLDEIYDRMVKLRHRMARNADCRDFREYIFKAMERFDYSAEDCLAFHEAIEKVACPAAAELARRRREKLGVESLRPWDLAVDPDNRPPLRPFETVDELIAGCRQIFGRVDSELGVVFDRLHQRGLLDLESRPGKAPGGYQAVLDERREPFIFMNAVGTEGDVRTLLHEGGHAFHSWSCRDEPLLIYREPPIEFAEVASMGMELLSVPHLEVFYADQTARSVKRFLEGIVRFFPYMACVDAQQHWVYTHPEATPEQRHEHWAALRRRFMPEVDYSGLEDIERQSWQRKLHFYEAPFYYVEYGIAQLGALQVWLNSRADYHRAVRLYRQALALGGSRPLPELFDTAGLRFDFSEQTLRPLIDALMAEIDRL